jgi:hypothetical protein
LALALERARIWSNLVKAREEYTDALARVLQFEQLLESHNRGNLLLHAESLREELMSLNQSSDSLRQDDIYDIVQISIRHIDKLLAEAKACPSSDE